MGFAEDMMADAFLFEIIPSGTPEPSGVLWEEDSNRYVITWSNGDGYVTIAVTADEGPSIIATSSADSSGEAVSATRRIIEEIY